MKSQPNAMRRPAVRVEVIEHGPPLDIDAWVERVIDKVMELEPRKPAVVR